MVPYLPNKISNTAIYIYLGVLAGVSIVFSSYAMSWDFLVMGVVWVVGFFGLVSYCGRRWLRLSEGAFVRNVVLTALGLRLLWVVVSWGFYMAKTGLPFEFSAADSLGYDGGAAWLATLDLNSVWHYLFADRDAWSDSGYLFYLQFVYRLTGSSIFLARVIKAGWGALTVYLIYRLAKRNLGQEVGRMAAVFACFMPNLIIYCGLHLKETEMLLLMVAFLERADYLLRSRHYTVLTIAVPVLLALSLFTFRTVLGAAAVFSLVTAVMFTSSRVMGKAKRWVLIALGLLAVALLTGGTITSEVESVWEDRGENQTAKRDYQTSQGSRWAKYATGSVMMPMMFFLPYPTMVDVDAQYNQQVMSGGNYVRNVLGAFVLIAVFSAIFITKNWRDLSLLGSFTIAYLGIISMSGFSNSERFLLPGLPGLLIMAAYGVSLLSGKSYRFVKIWYWVVPAMSIGWAIFKLGSRGLF